jgi:hypothetical protein
MNPPVLEPDTTTAFDSLEWGATDLETHPHIVVPPPGPQSKHWHERCTKYFKGLSSQVKLFPVTFESGQGCVLRDVDGNDYIDFSSGIYVTTLGHCHPKISEAIARAAHQLMNAHDFTTPVKTELMEKLAEILPGDLSGFQLYDSGTTAVEAGMRVLRAATGKNEMLSCFYDYHGKSYGAVSLGHIRSHVYGRVRALYGTGRVRKRAWPIRKQEVLWTPRCSLFAATGRRTLGRHRRSWTRHYEGLSKFAPPCFLRPMANGCGRWPS